MDGKSILSERLLAVLDIGYAAYYIYDPQTTPHYRVVSSAFRNTSNGPIQVHRTATAIHTHKTHTYIHTLTRQ